MKKVKPFYKSKQWERKRQVILKRDNYLCQESSRYGRTVAATTVHHIYPLEKYPELSLVNWNLISLSSAEHNAMHDRLTNEVTGNGLRWQKKFRKEFQNFYNPPPKA